MLQLLQFGIIGELQYKIIWVKERLNFSDYAVLANDIYHSLYHDYRLLSPSTLFLHISQSEKSTFFRGSTEIFICCSALHLMIGHNHYHLMIRSQSLTFLFLHLSFKGFKEKFCVKVDISSSKQINSKLMVHNSLHAPTTTIW